MDPYRIARKADEYKCIGHNKDVGRPKIRWEDDFWRFLHDRNRSYGLPWCLLLLLFQGDKCVIRYCLYFCCCVNNLQLLRKYYIYKFSFYVHRSTHTFRGIRLYRFYHTTFYIVKWSNNLSLMCLISSCVLILTSVYFKKKIRFPQFLLISTNLTSYFYTWQNYIFCTVNFTEVISLLKVS
jgi:hypothetical protein